MTDYRALPLRKRRPIFICKLLFARNSLTAFIFLLSRKARKNNMSLSFNNLNHLTEFCITGESAPSFPLLPELL